MTFKFWPSKESFAFVCFARTRPPIQFNKAVIVHEPPVFVSVVLETPPNTFGLFLDKGKCSGELQ